MPGTPLGAWVAIVSLLVICVVSTAFAVDPPPGAGAILKTQNTAEGQDALFDLYSMGADDTAVGFQALYNNTNGTANTAVGNLIQIGQYDRFL